MGNKPVYFDGAMGTQLIGLRLNNTKLTEMLNITNRDIIKNIHQSYLEAGSDFITTNTFGANKQKFSKEGQVEEIIREGVYIAKEACESYKDKYVILGIGPSGQLLKPIGEATFDEVYEEFRKQVITGKEAGCDAILFETFTDLYELKIAVLAAKENTNLPVLCTMSFEKNGRTFFGTSLESMIITLEALEVDALGVNCSYGPHELREVVKELVRLASIPIIVQPNAGLPIVTNGEVRYDLKAEKFSDIMEEFACMGVTILGGCCGTTPEYIKQTISKTNDIRHKEKSDEEIVGFKRTVVCSSRKVISFSGGVIIGECINPTGKLEIQEAINNMDLEYINSLAINQVREGASILDINLGMPGINEVEVLQEVVSKVQASVDVPLQIDSADYRALERAVRVYNGNPIINSVNGTRESLNNVLPIAKKYGTCIIALTLDENGIPKTAEDRLKIAKKIVKEAIDLGIKRENIIIDCLAVTMAAEQEMAYQTLEGVRLIKQELGIKTILGISNISFGLPYRSLINRTFLTMALTKGLDGAILNPSDETMKEAILAYRAVSGYDDGARVYIENYANKEETLQLTPKVQLNQISTEVIKKLDKRVYKSIEVNKNIISKAYKSAIERLQISIKQGIKEQIYTIVEECMESISPLDIIENGVIPVLDEIGELYGSGKVFLPELIRSSEVAKIACELLQKEINLTNDDCATNKTKIILATVEGDIHDIGKNIVKVILENYNFEVIDLGKDVSADTIVEAINRRNVCIVGLSALLTTSIKSMEDTISKIRKECIDVRVIIGGAVLTQEISARIGADFFAKDAVDTVKYAKSISTN